MANAKISVLGSVRFTFRLNICKIISNMNDLILHNAL